MVAVAQQEGTFQGTGDLRLFYKRWLPAEGKPQAVLIISHGNGEHTGRYEHVARWFAERRAAVYCLDHRGYGRSGGRRGYVNRFDEYLSDLRVFTGLVVDYSAGLGKPVLIGHSLGALIALRYAELYPDTLRALVLLSPWLALAWPISAPVRVLFQVLSAVTPGWQLNLSGDRGPDRVRRDPAMMKFIAGDPLRVRQKTPRWLTEVMRVQKRAVDDAMDLQLPSLWLQAGDDHVVSAAATGVTFERVRHPDKTFRLFPGAYHELHNEPEPERGQVFATIQGWLQDRGIFETGG